nr:hypothetical protein [Tanacetum cinerariifolium]GEY11274.1 hypothetical protein [Tanacetum cinerariifolium]GEY19066.1 hypothetical protein [Tanacetum cinerariifolium]
MAKVTAIEEAKDLATLALDNLKATLREQTSDGSDRQGRSDEDEDEGKYFNLMARNIRKGRENGNRGSVAQGKNVGVIIVGKCHFTNECPKPKENKAFVGGSWSDSENGFLVLGWHLEELHVTWAHFEKKQTRLRNYTKFMKNRVHRA